jgi:hypothetical protein
MKFLFDDDTFSSCMPRRCNRAYREASRLSEASSPMWPNP